MDHIGDALPSLMGLAKVYRAYDGAQVLLEQEIGRPICVQCGKCCRENTPIAWGVEAANAVSHLIGQGRLYPMQRRIEGWLLERHSQCTIYNPPKLDTVQNGLDPKLRDEVIALSRSQCVFYEDGCLLHDSRPLACRAFGVTRSNYTCTRPLGKKETESTHTIIAGPATQDLRQAVDMVLDLVPKPTWRHAGLFPTLIFAHAWPETFQKLVADNRIATAKLVMTYPTMAVLFEEDAQRISNSQHDLFRSGQKETVSCG